MLAHFSLHDIFCLRCRVFLSFTNNIILFCLFGGICILSEYPLSCFLRVFGELTACIALKSIFLCLWSILHTVRLQHHTVGCVWEVMRPECKFTSLTLWQHVCVCVCGCNWGRERLQRVSLCSNPNESEWAFQKICSRTQKGCTLGPCQGLKEKLMPTIQICMLFFPLYFIHTMTYGCQNTVSIMNFKAVQFNSLFNYSFPLCFSSESSSFIQRIQRRMHCLISFPSAFGDGDIKTSMACQFTTFKIGCEWVYHDRFFLLKWAVLLVGILWITLAMHWQPMPLIHIWLKWLSAICCCAVAT